MNIFMFIKFLIILIMAVKLITLNINGLNCKKKQQNLFEYIQENNFNIVNLQEHNLKNQDDLLDIFKEYFHVFISESINLKGGTAILLDKNITNNIIQVEKSSDSRITSVKFIVGKKQLHILNIYAPSGSKFHQERKELFKTEILYYLRNNLSNTLICGDFNCIINKRDMIKMATAPYQRVYKIP